MPGLSLLGDACSVVLSSPAPAGLWRTPWAAELTAVAAGADGSSSWRGTASSRAQPPPVRDAHIGNPCGKPHSSPSAETACGKPHSSPTRGAHRTCLWQSPLITGGSRTVVYLWHPSRPRWFEWTAHTPCHLVGAKFHSSAAASERWRAVPSSPFFVLAAVPMQKIQHPLW